MRAVVLRSPREPLRVEEVRLEGPRRHEVLVRVEAAGVCHTELHYMTGQIRCPVPIVLGHEGTGTIEELGADVEDLQPGQRVAFTWRPRCGQCEYCVTGRPVMCVGGRVQASTGGLMDGTTRLRSRSGPLHHFLGVSCFAEFAVVSRHAVVPIPSGVPPAVAAITGCAVVTGVGAVLNVAAAHGAIASRPLVVFGMGGVGLSAVMGCRLLGANPIVAVDISAEKLRLARQLGATHVVEASLSEADDAVTTVRELTNGGAEVAVEAVGTPRTLAQAFRALKPGGTLIALGLAASGTEMAVPINELVQQQKHIVGSLYGSANPTVDIPRLVKMHSDGQLPLEELIGATYPLEAANQAYEQLLEGSVGRAVLDPSM